MLLIEILRIDTLIQKGRQISLEWITQHNKLWPGIVTTPFVPGDFSGFAIWVVRVGIAVHYVDEYAPLLTSNLW